MKKTSPVPSDAGFMIADEIQKKNTAIKAQLLKLKTKPQNYRETLLIVKSNMQSVDALMLSLGLTGIYSPLIAQIERNLENA